MLVKTLTGKIHFIGEDDKTLCGLGIRESWASDDTLMFDSEDMCEKCLELFDEIPEEPFEQAGLEDLEKELEKDEPARGFKI